MAFARLALAVSAVGAGVTVGLLTSGGLAALVVAAVVIAAMNGYSKAYSP